MWDDGKIKLIRKVADTPPMIVPPKPWSSFRSGGYYGVFESRHNFLRFKEFALRTNVLKTYLARIEEIDLSSLYQAVNTVQNTPYSINREMLEIIDTLLHTGKPHGGMVGLDPEPELPMLPEPYSQYELQLHKREKSRRYMREIVRKQKALRALRILDIAKDYKIYRKIYFPCNLDFRGRLYPISFFNPQGDDMTKSLICYHEPTPAKHESDLDLLKIQGCNLWGNDKISLGDRVKYIDSIHHDIISYATDPYTFDTWERADEPLQFLAFCLEYKKAMEYIEKHGTFIGYKCHIVISYDGTCSGLQHYSALLHDEVGGKHVNLVPHDVPADIYQEVADKCIEAIKKDAQSDEYIEKRNVIIPKRDLAQLWLSYGITRKTVKPCVMTQPYGSGHYGYTETIKHDVIGYDDRFPANMKLHCADYLASKIEDAMRELVSSAVLGMECLQKIANEFIKDGVPVNWWTVLGLPVQQPYIKSTRMQMKTYVGGKVEIPTYYNTIDGTEKMRT